MGALAAIPWVFRLFRRGKKAVKTVRNNPWMLWALAALFVWWRVEAIRDARSEREADLAKALKNAETQQEALRVDRDKHEAAYENAAELNRRLKSVIDRSHKSKERWKRIAKDGTVIEFEREVERHDIRSNDLEVTDKKPVLPAATEIPGIPETAAKPTTYSWLLAGDYAVRQEMWAGTVYKIWRPWFTTGVGVGGPDITGTVSAHVMVSRFGASYAFSVPLEHKVRATVSF